MRRSSAHPLPQQPNALAPFSPAGRPRIPTGIAVLDRLIEGGIPRGELSEITGAHSSGKTSVLFSILAQATAGGERVAYIDPFDCLDASSAEKSGIELERFLWIRCFEASRQASLLKALRVADILTRGEGFGVVALDLDPLLPFQRTPAQPIPIHLWFRLRKSISGKPTALLLLSRHTQSGSASSVLLSMDRRFVRWKSSSNKNRGGSAFKHTRLLHGISAKAQVLRGKRHGQVTIHCGF